MFAFLATSDWRELVDEMGLPLKDRVAVALRCVCVDRVGHARAAS